MCGRYSLASPPAKIRLTLPFTGDEQLIQLRFNIAPTQLAPVIPPSGELKLMRWGLTPSRAGDKGAAALLINARSESVAVKPTFKRLLEHQRCLVVADGFYEWKKSGAQRLPYRFQLAGREPFAFAGLWDRGTDRQGKPEERFVILTTRANRVVQPLHDRMPVMLAPAQAEAWLKEDWQALSEAGLLEPLPAERLESYPVTPKLNNPRFDGPACLERREEPSSSPELNLG